MTRRSERRVKADRVVALLQGGQSLRQPPVEKMQAATASNKGGQACLGTLAQLEELAKNALFTCNSASSGANRRLCSMPLSRRLLDRCLSPTNPGVSFRASTCAFSEATSHEAGLYVYCCRMLVGLTKAAWGTRRRYSF